MPMPTDRVVLDTNSLLSSLARRGSAYPVWKGFQEGRYTLCVTTEILEEYEEVIARKTTPTVAENVLNTILESENVMRIDPYFHLHLITADPDDDSRLLVSSTTRSVGIGMMFGMKMTVSAVPSY